MSLLLLELGAHPGYIAATKIGKCNDDGAFFLDFSRPLRVERWLGVWNFRLGYPCALHVPVIHHAQRQGTSHIAVDRADAYFAELQRLWKARYPTARAAPSALAEAPKIAADFAHHFPAEVGTKTAAAT